MMATTLLRDAKAHSEFFDANALRHDFPVLHRQLGPNGKFAYLDNAASGQMPSYVSD